MYIRYFLYFFSIFSPYIYANNLENIFSKNCVYENNLNQNAAPLGFTTFRITESDFKFNTDLNSIISELYYPNAPENTGVIIHCSQPINLQWIIDAQHYKDNIFETGIPGIGFKLLGNGEIFSINDKTITIKAPYVDNCPYNKIIKGYNFRYCSSSWNGLHIKLVKINSNNNLSSAKINSYLDGVKFNQNSFLISPPKTKTCQLNINEPVINLKSIDKTELSYYNSIHERKFSIDVNCDSESLVKLKIDSLPKYQMKNKSILALLNGEKKSGVGLLMKYNEHLYILGTELKNRSESSDYKYTFNFSVSYLKTEEEILTGAIQAATTVTMEYN